MSSPINRRSPSPIPSTSSQNPTPPVSNTLQTTLLIKDLLEFSLKRRTPGAIRQCLPPQTEDMILVKVTSDLMKSIANETAKTATEIAAAVIGCGINLSEKIKENVLLTHQEILKIKSFLRDDQPSTSAAALQEQAIQDAPASVQGHTSASPSSEASLQASLPIKKQKLRWGSLIVPSVPTLQEESLASKCSLKSLIVLLESAKANRLRPSQTTFQCPQQHEEDFCNECRPLATLLKCLKNTEKEPCAQQISTLLRYTSPEVLALALYANPKILSRLLQGKHIKNHQLAILIEEGSIHKSIYSARTKNPSHLTGFYKTIENLIDEGINTPLIQSILHVWQHNAPSTNTSAIIEILQNGVVEKHHADSLSVRVPSIERFYLRDTPRSTSLYETHVRRAMTKNFAKFLSKIAITTLLTLQNTSGQHLSLFTDTPEGKRPDMKLVEKLFAVILLSHSKWHLLAPPCKASINYLSQQMTFDSESKRILSEALDKFLKLNIINLPGAHTPEEE